MMAVGRNSYVLVSLLLVYYCFSLDASHVDRQLLECKLEPSIRNGTNTPCSPARNVSSTSNSSHQITPTSNGSSHQDSSLSIDFNNIVRRTADDEVESNCTRSDRSDATDSIDVICQPKAVDQSGNLERSNEQRGKKIEVKIVPVGSDAETVANVESTNVRAIELGSTNIIQCLFTLVQDTSNGLELKFRLRWLRSVASSQGYQNRSISTNEGQQQQQPQHDQISITTEDKRTWTVQRQGGLDLFINDFRRTDEGDYFCQALTLADKSDESGEPAILDEKRIHLTAHESSSPLDLQSQAKNQIDSDDSLNRDTSIYSQENLQKLLPSLQVVPEYSEVALGDKVQLACVTRELDPDPDPERIQWSFEQLERPGFKSHASKPFIGAGAAALPDGCTQMGNVLVIWAMSHETVGLFKCSYHLDDFNLTAEAAGELMLRPSVDSAPLVFVTPELLRVSANGSASIQCEATGYPAPKVEWYRVDMTSEQLGTTTTTATLTSGHQNETLSSGSKYSMLENLEGVEIKLMDMRDAMAFCEQSGCLAINNNRLQGRTSEVLVTGLSLIQINQARAHHQGQYVCMASNKHGQNQASTLVDVEFKESPRVRIGDEYKEQTIVLEAAGFGQVAKMQSVTFKCSVEAGQPAPRLKWLRTTSGGGLGVGVGNLGSRSKPGKEAGGNHLTPGTEHHFSKAKFGISSSSAADMDIFDLTRVSSATSKVSTRYENGDKTLALHLSTISVDDEGEYICVAENELGRHSAVARLTVQRPAQVSILQTSPRIFRPNDSFQLDCLASGHPAPLDIEWSRSDRGAFFALISQQASTLLGDSVSSSTSSSNGDEQQRAVLKFDRVTDDDAGEYTCAARNPLNSSAILSDTIMLMLEQDEKSSAVDRWSAHNSVLSSQRQLPKLMIRPTKVSAQVGSNVTLDCLAISGLQPTVVEWLPPAIMAGSLANVSIKAYYRSGAPSETNSRGLLQLGSKLRIINVTKAHEGVYQCKGRNKIGLENAPALVEVIDQSASQSDPISGNRETSFESNNNNDNKQQTETKTKIAKVGSNIELRCQVNGMVEQPATSWSRDGRELPATSVQIGHNLWIQNLSKSDEGLYLCSARSNEPNQIIQAKIKLLVRGFSWWRADDQVGSDGLKHDPASVAAKIVASKSNPNLGDSVTLECMISFVNRTRDEEDEVGRSSSLISRELEELERQVVWTNLHSGQSLFQDNVYIQNNLLIIYDLRQENAASYRCHFNDLSQHTDFELSLASNAGSDSSRVESLFNSFGDEREPNQTRQILNLDERRVKQVTLAPSSPLHLECPGESNSSGKYFWTRGNGAHLAAGKHRWQVGRDSQPLIIESVDTQDADLYQCNRFADGANGSSEARILHYFLVQVETVAARFVQRPVSFISLPAVRDADQQLELEMKFLPEQEDGLLLFSGGPAASVLANGSQRTGSNNQPDYISLGLVSGRLEFKFELGDGETVLRSSKQVELNQWHRLVIERSRRGATMWLDGQPPTSNSSSGKFFNLNLDSLLYVGGHQAFLSRLAKSKERKVVYNHDGSMMPSAAQSDSKTRGNFHGFSQGFQGCISSLSINGRQVDLMARNRGVSMGIFECDRAECSQTNCTAPQGLCQPDRSINRNREPNEPFSSSRDRQEARQRHSLVDSDLRCICLPPFHGLTCNQTLNASEARSFLEITSGAAEASKLAKSDALDQAAQSVSQPDRSQLAACDQLVSSNQKRCNLNGTSQCEVLSSSSFKCHCKLGFGGELCEHQVSFANDTSVWFNQEAYVQLAFKSADKIADFGAILAALNESEYTRLTTFTDQLNISLRLQTRSSYGLLFYTGSVGQPAARRTAVNTANSYRQVSKSVVANLLARLSSGANGAYKVADYLALALVDGHIELSYELGSGVVVLRSTRRFNDGLWHQIEAFRWGKQATLLLDGLHKYDAQSPGKLSALNAPGDIYLGGLPMPTPSSLAANSSLSNLQLLSSFAGCISELRLNSLGPIALTRTDQLTQLKGLRNLLPCKSIEQLPALVQEQTSKLATSAPGSGASSASSQQQQQQPLALKPSRKPTKPPASAESDSDDPDELAAA